MKQILNSLTLLLCAALPATAQKSGSYNPYDYMVIAIDSGIAECPGAMIGDISNHINPTVYYTPNPNCTDIHFDLLSLQDFEPHPTDMSHISIAFDDGSSINFASTTKQHVANSPRMSVYLEEVSLEDLSRLATHDIVSWTIDDHTIPILTPTAGIFSAMFKAIDLRDAQGQRPAMIDVRPAKNEFGRNHLCMAVRPKDATDYAHLMLLNADQWRRLRNKERFSQEGILLNYGQSNCFLLDYNDRYDDCGYPAWHYAVENYGQRLPTKEQADLISGCEVLRDVATAFGGDNYGNYYWTRTECPAPDDNSAFVFCPGIPDAAIDRQDEFEPDNAGVLLVDTIDYALFRYYFNDILE